MMFIKRSELGIDSVQFKWAERIVVVAYKIGLVKKFVKRARLTCSDIKSNFNKGKKYIIDYTFIIDGQKDELIWP